MHVIQNICVITGKYTNHEGQEKNRYVKVGRVMQNEEGAKMYVLDKTFNPAGINNGRDSVILNMFDIKNDRNNVNQQASPHQYSGQPGQQRQYQQSPPVPSPYNL